MIVDELKNARKYCSINHAFEKAFMFLERNDLSKMADGKYEIEGDGIYASLSRYDTKSSEKSLWEAHKKYIDIHLVVSGVERIGYSQQERLMSSQDYNDEKDVMLLAGTGDFVTIKPGMFAIFFAGEAHMPGTIIDTSQAVTKVVIKVKAK